MKISIITPTFNSEAYIRKTIESVLDQKGDFDLEYILKDGGSTDRTLEIAEKYNPKLRIVRSCDGGPSNAINQGMAVATGEISGWIGSDDILIPGSLSRVAAVFRSNRDIEWVTGKSVTINGDGKVIHNALKLYADLTGSIINEWRLLSENTIRQPSTFWKMELWRKVGGLSTKYKYAFDYDLWLRMFKQAGKPVWIPEDLSAFRRHDASLSERNYKKQFSEELEISKKYTDSSMIHMLHWLTAKRNITIYNLLSYLKSN